MVVLIALTVSAIIVKLESVSINVLIVFFSYSSVVVKQKRKR